MPIRVFKNTTAASNFLKKGAAVTIGNFDGVHIGHRAILSALYFKAQELGLKSVVLTFDPHPIKVLAPNMAPQLINTTAQKIELIGKLGIDAIVVQKFDRRFASISPQNFFCKKLIGDLRTRYLTVGYDFTFGAMRAGTIETLEILGYQNNVEVDIIDAKTKGTVLASSTSIRRLIAMGDITQAMQLLERPYFIDGTVVHGHHRGKELGIQTANLAADNELLIKDGVYATIVSLGNRVFNSVTNIGFNPTFGDKQRSIETHILGFNQSIYRKKIRLLFIKRLRDERKFATPVALVKQIRKDIATATKALQHYREEPTL